MSGPPRSPAEPAAAARPQVARAARRWFLQPPRPHGQVLDDRSVGQLELFYDLVFVVFVGRLAHHLAGHVTARGALDFAVLFAVLWITWFNGSMYHELHGREDGRARALMFAQMLLLAVLATEAAEAGGADGQAFAWALAGLLFLQTLQWWTVYRIDEPQYRPLALPYLLGSLVAIVVAVVAALIADPDTRLIAWGAFLLVTVGGGAVRLSGISREMTTLRPTGSLVERFGLFVIIVLGEIVVGVVDGLSASDRDARTIATGLLALTVSFGFWWTYFDLVGDRLPRAAPRALIAWFLTHLPLTLAIAAAGAGMVGLVEHAAEARTPQPTAWLISGSVAAVLLVAVPLARTVGGKGAATTDPVVEAALAAGGVVALLVGAAHPAPWLLALLLLLVLVAVWWLAFPRWLAGGGAAHVLGERSRHDVPDGRASAIAPPGGVRS